MPAKRPTAGISSSSQGLIPSSQPAVIEDASTSRNHVTNGPPVLPPFDIRNFLTRRASSEILADLDPETQNGASPPPSNPSPPRCPETPIPHSPPSTPGFHTPESTVNRILKVRLVRLESSPSSSRSKRSVDTEGDVKMLNGVFTTPERRSVQQRDEIRAMVIQSVHDNFEFERARLADEVGRQVLASLGDEVEWSVRERVDRVLCAAVGEPMGGELGQVTAVRELLRRMSHEARVRVFCTEEMVGILRKLIAVVDMEMRLEAWTFVEDRV